MTNTKLSNLSKILLGLAGACLIISIFVPIWRIELDAPQYPEGLNLLIYSNKLGGNVEIINGLNHYIGMKTLHAEEFIEFTVLPYIIGFFGLFSLAALLLNSKKLLYALMICFIIFGIVAMVDFWRWEYNYGHNLDPNAAIIVPGMAYQPPLIGFKQLLNFGAYSIPDMGGWLFILSGLMMLISCLREMNILNKKTMNTKIVTALLFAIVFSSCGSDKPEPIKLNEDNCDYCKMTISNGQFAAEAKTSKGRYYKFDDISCLIGYAKENNQVSFTAFYVNNFLGKNELIDATKASYITSESIGSPMGGNIAAFKTQGEAKKLITKYNANDISWKEIYK